jgi:hypothetical protein
MRFAAIALFAAVLSALSGCASMTREQIAYESAYQALHVVDTIQTLKIRKHSLVYETNPILGKHPSDAEVISYMAAESVAHFFITSALSRSKAPRWLNSSWHYLSIGWNGRNVVVNYRNGL